MHHADQEIFQIAVDRWKRITDSVETYEKHIDEHLRDVIKELNDNPKLKTLWCCQGHTREEKGKTFDNFEQMKRFEQEGINRFKANGYISFVTTEDNLDILQGLSDWIMSDPVRDIRGHLSCFVRMTRLRLRGITGLEEDFDKHYPVFTIEFKYNPYQDIKRIKFKEFFKTLPPYLQR